MSGEASRSSSSDEEALCGVTLSRMGLGRTWGNKERRIDRICNENFHVDAAMTAEADPRRRWTILQKMGVYGPPFHHFSLSKNVSGCGESGVGRI